MRKLLVIAILAVSAASIAWLTGAVSRHDSDDIVAVVGNETVNADQYRKEYVDYLLQTGLQDELRLRHSFLNRMIDMRVLTLYATDSLNMEQHAGFKREIERARRKLLIEGYLRKAVYDTLTISERDLEEMFVRVNTQLKASHLYARTLGEAADLKRRLDAGETFEDLAREVFADPVLAQSGGSLGYFGFDEMDPRFEEAAYSMKVGDVSNPVQTATGYSIIRLEDRKVHPLLTEYEYATRRDRIKTYVTYRKQIEARQALRESILDEVNPRIEGRAVELFAGAVGAPSDSWSTLANEELSAVTIRVADENLSVAQLLDEARFTDDRQLAATNDLENAVEVLKGLIVRLELLDRAQKSRIAAGDDYQSALASARRKQLYEGAWNHFRSTTAVDEDSLRSYFERHGDEFVVPERVRLREIVLDSGEQAHSLLAGLSSSNFGAVAALHSIRPGADRTGGDLGYVTRDQMGIVADAVFSAEPGTLLGPLDAMGRFAIFLVGERQSPRPASFEEARGEIETRLINDVVRAVVESRIAAVRRHYNIKRFPERVESIELRNRVST